MLIRTLSKENEIMGLRWYHYGGDIQDQTTSRSSKFCGSTNCCGCPNLCAYACHQTGIPPHQSIR